MEDNETLSEGHYLIPIFILTYLDFKLTTILLNHGPV